MEGARFADGTWRKVGSLETTCDAEAFLSGVKVWVERPQVVNRRLVGAEIVERGRGAEEKASPCVRDCLEGCQESVTSRCPHGCSGTESCSLEKKHRRRRRRRAHVTRREVQQRSIKDHFAVRRSGRRCKSVVENERRERNVSRLRCKEESGLKVVEVDGKGRGVRASRPFSKGDLVCEYSGELIPHEEAKRREEEYSLDPSIGCYMYYFSHRSKNLCVDGTADNGRMGRLLNHSRTEPNVITKLVEVDEQPYLCLVAARDIEPGEELQYDYGERNREAVDSHPWLTT